MVTIVNKENCSNFKSDVTYLRRKNISQQLETLSRQIKSLESIKNSSHNERLEKYWALKLIHSIFFLF